MTAQKTESKTQSSAIFPPAEIEVFSTDSMQQYHTTPKRPISQPVHNEFVPEFHIIPNQDDEKKWD